MPSFAHDALDRFDITHEQSPFLDEARVAETPLYVHLRIRDTGL